jgi:hypothetical protein
MRKAYGIRCGSFWFAITVALLAALTLAACGNSSTSTGSGASSSSPAPTATPTSVKGYGTSHGCPSDVVVNSAPGGSAVVVKASQNQQTITVRKGDTVIFELPFGQRWYNPSGSQGVLEMQQPSGYALQSAKVCVWRFVAQGTGQTSLIFTAQALCKPNQACPQYVLQLSFTINVK